MEKEKEVSRLTRVLRQIVFAERFLIITGKRQDLSEFNLSQYNRILARLKELEPAIENLFVELSEGTSPRLVRVAARELAEYFADDAKSNPNYQHFGHCRKRPIFAGFAPITKRSCGW